VVFLLALGWGLLFAAQEQAVADAATNGPDGYFSKMAAGALPIIEKDAETSGVAKDGWDNTRRILFGKQGSTGTYDGATVSGGYKTLAKGPVSSEAGRAFNDATVPTHTWRASSTTSVAASDVLLWADDVVTAGFSFDVNTTYRNSFDSVTDTYQSMLAKVADSRASSTDVAGMNYSVFEQGYMRAATVEGVCWAAQSIGCSSGAEPTSSTFSPSINSYKVFPLSIGDVNKYFNHTSGSVSDTNLACPSNTCANGTTGLWLRSADWSSQGSAFFLQNNGNPYYNPTNSYNFGLRPAVRLYLGELLLSADSGDQSQSASGDLRLTFVESGASLGSPTVNGDAVVSGLSSVVVSDNAVMSFGGSASGLTGGSNGFGWKLVDPSDSSGAVVASGFDADGVNVTLPAVAFSHDTYELYFWAQHNGSATAGWSNSATVPVKVSFRSQSQVTVSYHVNGGTGAAAPGGVQVVPGSPVVLASMPAGLVKAGYRFAGWNTLANGSGTSYAAGSTQSFSSDVTLYARWLSEYAVSYVLNGASNAGSNPSSYTVDDLPLSLTSPSSLSGFTFAGWYANADFSGAAVTSIPAGTTGAKTYYAKWTYTVTYNGNSPTTGTVPTATVGVKGQPVTMATNSGTLALTGYSFAGWNASAAGTGADYATGSSQTFTGNTTVYAKWTYTITYDKNTASSGSVPSSTVGVKGQPVTMATNSGTLALTGYSFAGWNATAAGTGTSYATGSSQTFTGNTTVYAKWTYTVTYDKNTASSGSVPTATVGVKGQPITMATNSGTLALTGYSFAGWNANTAGTGADYATSSSQTFTGNTTVYAKWTYTVTYSGNGNSTGSAPSSTVGVKGQPITMATNSGTLALTGYSFAGWNSTAAGTGTSYAVSSSQTFSGHTTVYAKWTYTVTYNGNGNSTGSAPSSTVGVKGQPVTMATNSGSLALTGYSFAGWNANTAGTGTSYAVSSSQTFTGHTTVYAKWTYTVTYNGNGNSTGSVPTATVGVKGQPVTMAANTGSLALTNYDFAGWNATAAGTGTSYAVSSSQTFTGHTTVYAKWTYTVTYNGNGNSTGSVPSSTVGVKGQPITMATNSGTLALTNYDFAGWNSTAAGTGTSYAVSSSQTFTGHTTVYAKWTYTVTYNGNGNSTGSAPSSTVGVKGQSVTMAGNTGTLALTGYSFAGWNANTNGIGTDYATGSSQTFSGHTMVYAKWTYTVTYDKNTASSGSVPTATVGVKGQPVTMAGNTGTLALTGYSFAGWNANIAGTGADYATGSSQTFTGNTTVFAKWTYTVTYDKNTASSGSVPSSTVGVKGQPVTMATNSGTLALTGYSFAGWNASAAGTGTSYAVSSSQTFSGHTTVYAKWTYTVTYDKNTASSGSVPTAAVGVKGQPVTMATNSGSLALTNYSFAGWNANANGIGTDYATGSSQTFSGHTTVYAKWTYTVTYDKNTASSGSVPTATVGVKGQSITMATNTGTLALTSYTFAGWNSTAVGTGTSYAVSSSQTFSGNTTVYAKWTYTVTYNGNGNSTGSVPAATVGVKGQPITMATNSGTLALTGYTFAGWNANTAGTGTSYAVSSSQTFSGHTTVYAKWTYTVTYDKNTASSGSVPTATVGVKGQPVTMAGNTGTLALTGYSFAGWNSTAVGTGADYATGSSQTFSGNTTVYAKWTYTVTYNGNGNSTGSVPTATVGVKGQPVTMATNSGSLALTNYSFAGWNANANGIGTDYATGSSQTFSGHTTVYAKWTYTLTYDKNTASSGSVPTATVGVKGQPITMATNTGTLALTNYDFAGWNSTAAGTGTSYAVSSSQTFTGHTTVYAKWTYTITYDKNTASSGSVPAATIGVKGQPITMATNSGSLALTGYSFAGWNATAAGTGISYATGSSQTFTGHTTVYAKWTYMITYDKNTASSGSVPAVTVGVKGQPVTMATNSGSLGLTNYDFAGWNASAAGTGADYATGSSQTFTGHTTVYAKWTYTVTYDQNDATSGMVPMATVGVKGQPVTMAANTGTLALTDYDFAGWNSTAAGTGTSYAVSSSQTFTGHTTVYVKWTYTVTYDVNGGSGAVAPSDVVRVRGESVVLADMPVGLVRAGYRFVGWNTAADGSGVTFATGVTYPGGNVDLFARWVVEREAVAGEFFEYRVRVADASVPVVVPTNGRSSDATTFGQLYAWYVEVSDDRVDWSPVDCVYISQSGGDASCNTDASVSDSFVGSSADSTLSGPVIGTLSVGDYWVRVIPVVVSDGWLRAFGTFGSVAHSQAGSIVEVGDIPFQGLDGTSNAATTAGDVVGYAMLRGASKLQRVGRVFDATDAKWAGVSMVGDGFATDMFRDTESLRVFGSDSSLSLTNLTTVGAGFFQATFKDAANATDVAGGLVLPAQAFNIGKIVTVGVDFFRATFSGVAKLATLPVGSFRLAVGLTVAADNFFAECMQGANGLSKLPDNSFNTEHLTDLHHDGVFSRFHFNTAAGSSRLTALPAGSFTLNSAATAVGDDFLAYGFTGAAELRVLPSGSFNTGSVVSVGDNFMSHVFEHASRLRALPAGAFDSGKITTLGSGFLEQAFSGDSVVDAPHLERQDIEDVAATWQFSGIQLNSAVKSLYRTFYHVEVGGSLEAAQVAQLTVNPNPARETFTGTGMCSASFNRTNWGLLDTCPVLQRFEFQVDVSQADIDAGTPLLVPTNGRGTNSSTVNAPYAWQVDIDMGAGYVPVDCAATPSKAIGGCGVSNASIFTGTSADTVNAGPNLGVMSTPGSYWIRLRPVVVDTGWLQAFATTGYQSGTYPAHDTASRITAVKDIPFQGIDHDASTSNAGDDVGAFMLASTVNLTTLGAVLDPVRDADWVPVTSTGSGFMSSFASGASLLTGIPDGSLNITQLTSVGERFMDSLLKDSMLKSLPAGSFIFSEGLTSVPSGFLHSSFEGARLLAALPERSFDISNIQSVGTDFMSHTFRIDPTTGGRGALSYDEVVRVVETWKLEQGELNRVGVFARTFASQGTGEKRLMAYHITQLALQPGGVDTDMRDTFTDTLMCTNSPYYTQYGLLECGPPTALPFTGSLALWWWILAIAFLTFSIPLGLSHSQAFNSYTLGRGAERRGTTRRATSRATTGRVARRRAVKCTSTSPHRAPNTQSNRWLHS
jgi:uncharacterized repeat protein (TIGR02543 family)